MSREEKELRQYQNEKYVIVKAQMALDHNMLIVCLFDLILYVHSTIFQLCGTGLPGLNQY